MSDYYTFEIKCPHCKKNNWVCYMDDEYAEERATKCEFCKKKFQIEMTFKVKKV